jgi:integrase
MPRVARGHVEQLPSGSFRAVVYAGVDPLTRRPVYLKACDVPEFVQSI